MLLGMLYGTIFYSGSGTGYFHHKIGGIQQFLPEHEFHKLVPLKCCFRFLIPFVIIYTPR